MQELQSGARPDRDTTLYATYSWLSAGDRSTETCVISGRLLARRKHGASLVFLDLGCADASVQLHVSPAEEDRTCIEAAEPALSAPLGSLMRARGTPGRTARGVLSLFCVPAAVELVEEATEAQPGPNWSATAPPPRFHITPNNVRWGRALALLKVGAYNALAWRGGLPLPEPPPTGPCWLLPATDDAALAIAAQQAELRRAGWWVLTCDAELVDSLSNKVRLRARAAALGLLAHLPEHYASADAARYPCVLKGAEGQYGKGVHIVRDAAEARRRAPSGPWLLQELIPGQTEWSASLLWSGAGELVAVAAVRYTYDRAEYVWPHAEELKERRTSHAALPARHVDVFRALLDGYVGVCNVNYKMRRGGDGDEGDGHGDGHGHGHSHGDGDGDGDGGADGHGHSHGGGDGDGGALAILEVNTRCGGDLAADCARPIAADFFAALERLGSGAAHGHRRTDDADAAGATAVAETAAAAEAKATAAAAAAATTERVVYLSERRDESPRYATPQEAPGWLRPAVRAQHEGGADGLDDDDDGFLLRGADSPALQIELPPPRAPARRGGGAALVPAVLVLPGGGYAHLAPNEGAPAQRWLAGLGVASALLRYRLPPRHPWPASLDDATAALALLQSADAAHRWGIDPDRVGVLGFSAGAHLAALAASASLRAVVLVYPPLVDCPAQLHALETVRLRRQTMRMRGGSLRPPPCAEISPPRSGVEASVEASGGGALGALAELEARVDAVRSLGEARRADGPPPPAAACGAAGSSSHDDASSWPAWYVVASTNDRICPADEIDEIVAELQRRGVRCTYQRQKLGAHGFGVASRWTSPCAEWLRRELQLEL